MRIPRSLATAVLAPALGLVVTVATLLAIDPGRAGATPVFSRKYGFACTMCHSAFPRLNDWGQAFRDNGYQIPGQESREKTVLESPAPFAMRTSVGFLRESQSHAPDAFHREGFKVTGLDILSNGVLSRHAAYEMVVLPQLADSRDVAGQEGTIETASVVLRDLACSPWLNVRVGRFEPAYVALSVKRQLSIAPREVYAYGPPGAGFVFAEPQDGVEVTGYGHCFSYAAGLLNGSATNHPDDDPTDVYARAAMVIGAGRGQTAGQRIGVSGYLGRARPDVLPGDRQHLSRLGIDASLNYATLNLAGQFLVARDNKSLWGFSRNDAHWSGWFAELSWQPLFDCVAFARFDRVETPVTIPDVTRWTVGARYYLAGDLALHGEFSQRTIRTGAADLPTEEMEAVRLDFAF